MKISIIIPVYNCEEFIDKCIASVRQQTDPNWELILIDDGSSDDSFKICEKYSKIDDRIKVYRQANSGPSVARNNGLKYSTGTHCLFIDSDDWIEHNCLEILKNEVLKSKADIIFFGYYHDILRDNKVVNSQSRELKEHLYDLNSEFFEHLEDYSRNGATNQVWNKLYNKNLIITTEATFPEHIRYTEDLVFNLKLYKNAQRIQIINNKLYHYVSKDRESLATNFNINRVIELKEVYSSLFENITEWCPKNINYFYNCFVHELSVFINSMFKRNTQLTFSEKRALIKNITNDLWIQNIIRNTNYTSLRNKILGYFIRYKCNFLLYSCGRLVRIIRPV